MFSRTSKIYVAGHTGLLGSALLRKFSSEGYSGVVTRTRKELELSDKTAVFSFFEKERPEFVFLAAGKVGGITGNNTYPADFLHANISIQDNVFEAAQKHGVERLVFYGSSCTYPKLCPQPMREDNWLTGPVEETSLGYAAAKIAGIAACKVYNKQYKTNRFIALIPNSMYGPNDNFDLENSHVLSALIRRFYEAGKNGAPELELWGSGSPRREFVYAGDIADASVFAVQNADRLENRHYNIGSGEDYSIKELAETVSGIIGFKGLIKWDTSKPDGAPRKLLDSSRFLALGWKPAANFKKALAETCRWYIDKVENNSK
jgi:GDP-L-fucose synthase